MSDTTKIVHYTAAGGVVMVGGRVLVLHRPARGEVRLPKGHVEAHEDPRTTALREVAEESGFGDLEITTDLGEMENEFDSLDTDGSPMHVVRTERYFLMTLTSPRKIDRPDEDAEQFTSDLMEPAEAIEALTYDAEKEWVRRALASATPG
ncbi:MAG TPA: NUDIX domain-containing protein [Actinomycetota bacterium]